MSSAANPADHGVSAPFTLIAPTVTVLAPNAAVTWRISTAQSLRFTQSGGVGQSFSFDVSRDAGTTWSELATLTTTGASATSPVDGGRPADNQRADSRAVGGRRNRRRRQRRQLHDPPKHHRDCSEHRCDLGRGLHANGDVDPRRRHRATGGHRPEPRRGSELGVSGGWCAKSQSDDRELDGTASPYRQRSGADTRQCRGDAGRRRCQQRDLHTGAACARVTAPSGNVAWGVGTSRVIRWTHNLEYAERVHIDVSRDGGGVGAGGIRCRQRRCDIRQLRLGRHWTADCSEDRLRVVWASDTSVQNAGVVSFRIN